LTHPRCVQGQACELCVSMQCMSSAQHYIWVAFKIRSDAMCAACKMNLLSRRRICCMLCRLPACFVVFAACVCALHFLAWLRARLHPLGPCTGEWRWNLMKPACRPAYQWPGKCRCSSAASRSLVAPTYACTYTDAGCGRATALQSASATEAPLHAM
jgi:hypothetical protein